MIAGDVFHYEIQYTKAADKFMRNHEDIRSQYEAAIRELLLGYYRIRLGDYRVVYAVINGKIVVITTLLAGSRGDVYKKMSGLK